MIPACSVASILLCLHFSVIDSSIQLAWVLPIVRPWLGVHPAVLTSSLLTTVFAFTRIAMVAIKFVLKRVVTCAVQENNHECFRGQVWVYAQFKLQIDGRLVLARCCRHQQCARLVLGARCLSLDSRLTRPTFVSWCMVPTTERNVDNWICQPNRRGVGSVSDEAWCCWLRVHNCAVRIDCCGQTLSLELERAAARLHFDLESLRIS